MKSRGLIYSLLSLAICGLTMGGCKKDNSTTPATFTSGQVAQVQNSDTQDATADKNDQDVDVTLEQLQVTNYQNVTSKSLLTSGSKIVTVDHPDSTYFPKVVTIVYSNYQDSTADESFIRNGEIDVTVTANGSDKQLTTRVQTFKDYSVTTDSTTVTINGTRTVTKTAHTYKLKWLTSLRVSATDIITANLKYAVVKTGATDTLKFTRIVDKTRKTILHYSNIGGNTWKTVKFRNILAQDTISYTGTISGVNEEGNNYSKIVSIATPLVITYYKGTPIMSSGTMELSITGNTTASFTFTYREDPNHPHRTLVTVTNNATGKTHSFDRILSRKYVKWW